MFRVHSLDSVRVLSQWEPSETLNRRLHNSAKMINGFFVCTLFHDRSKGIIINFDPISNERGGEGGEGRGGRREKGEGGVLRGPDEHSSAVILKALTFKFGDY